MSDSENQAENADSSGTSIYIYISFFSAIFTKISFKDHIKSWPHFYLFFNMKNKPQVKLIYTKLKSNVLVLN